MSAYAPAMMVCVLLYGYATGVYSSRKIQTKTYDDVAFRFLSADEHPDHSMLAELEREVAEKTEQERAAAEAKLAARKEKEEKTGKKQRGREPQIPAPEQGRPDARAQRNFTNPESRIMPDGADRGSCLQGYNA